MVLFGITGGIGMGKSASAAILTRRGLPLVDTDELARRETAAGTPALQEVARVFGAEVLDEAGGLRRGRLAQIVFSDPAARGRLEAILHPRIAAAWQGQVNRWREERVPAAAVVIPLLFEKGYEREFDVVVCVACTGQTQTRRLGERGWTEAQIAARNAAQLPVADKAARSRFVVWTEGAMAVHERQWDRILPGG